MNIERILKRFKDNHRNGRGIKSSPEEARNLIKLYQSIPLTLPITDESMRRVCETLTRAGYQTIDSCEGHQQITPIIFLRCAGQYHLRHLTSILIRESEEKSFPWDLRTHTGEVFLNPSNPLLYTMEPNLAFTNLAPTNINDYQRMIDDLDIIGISVLRYFTSVDLESLEEDREKIDNKAREFRTPELPEEFFRE